MVAQVNSSAAKLLEVADDTAFQRSEGVFEGTEFRRTIAFEATLIYLIVVE